MFARQISRNLFKAPICFNNGLSFRFVSERAAQSVKPGRAIVIDGVPHKVGKIVQGKRGKGGGYVRGFLKNLITGVRYDKTFTSDEMVEVAELEKEKCTFTWKDGSNFAFMNSVTFEEIIVTEDEISDPDFLSDGMEVTIVKFNDEVIGVQLPTTSVYTVVGFSQGSSSHGQVMAVLDTGASVLVPSFVKEGTKVKVNIEEKEYKERA